MKKLKLSRHLGVVMSCVYILSNQLIASDLHQVVAPSLHQRIRSRILVAYNYVRCQTALIANCMTSDQVQAEENIFDKNHFMIFLQPSEIDGTLDQFLIDFRGIGMIADILIRYLKNNTAYSNETKGFYIRSYDKGYLLNHNLAGLLSQLIARYNHNKILFAQFVAKEAVAQIVIMDTHSLQIDGIVKIHQFFQTIRQMAPSVAIIKNIDALYNYQIEEHKIIFKNEMKSLNESQSRVIVFGIDDDFKSFVSNESLEKLQFKPLFILQPLVHRLDEIRIIQLFQETLQGVDLSDNVNIVILARLIIKSYEWSTSFLNLPKTKNAFKQIVALAQEIALQQGLTYLNMKHLEQACYSFVCGFYETFHNEIAMHEAGHAVLGLHMTPQFQVMHSASIQQQFVIGLPIMQSEDALPHELTIEDHKNNIIFLFAGTVAESILENKISCFGCCKMNSSKCYSFEMSLDRSLIMKSVQTLINDGLTTQSKDEILEECYKKTITLIMNYKDEIKKIAHVLRKKGTITGDEMYDLLKIDKPLYDFQQGPLPESLVSNYALRSIDDENISTDIESFSSTNTSSIALRSMNSLSLKK